MFGPSKLQNVTLRFMAFLVVIAIIAIVAVAVVTPHLKPYRAQSAGQLPAHDRSP